MNPTVPNGGPQLDKIHQDSPADYYNLDQLLTPKQRSLRHRTRHFMETKIAPFAPKAYENAGWKRHQLETLKELNLGGGYLQGYGCAGIDFISFCMVCLEMFRVDAAVGTFYMIHNSISMPSIAYCGSEEQKKRFLPEMAKLNWFGSFALTESRIGSDAAHIQLKARKSQLNGKSGWILNGNKRWIGAGTIADINVVWASIDSDGSDNGKIVGFIVPKDTKGFSAKKIENKIALRGMINADMTFSDCFIPESLRLPGCRDFRSGPGRVLVNSRVLAAWASIGMAMGAYDCALEYAKQRKQFNSSLAGFQMVQSQLVRMLGLIQSSIYMCWRVTTLSLEKKMTPGHSGLLKAHVTRSTRRVVALARDIMGGNGILADHRVGRAFVDSEALYSYEGAYNINVLLVGREITGHNAFFAPQKRSRARSRTQKEHSVPQPQPIVPSLTRHPVQSFKGKTAKYSLGKTHLPRF